MSIIKNLFYQSIDKSGLNYLARRKNANSVLILTYHLVLPYSDNFKRFDYRNVVSTDAFDQQIKFLRNNYDVISMDEAVRLLSRKWQKGNYAVITFDDGFKNNYLHAFPVLKNNGVSAAFYVCTDFIDEQKVLWTEQITALLTFTKREKIRLILNKPVTFHLRGLQDVEWASIKIRRYLKVKPAEEKNRVLSQLLDQCSDVTDIINEDAGRYAFMNWSELNEMAEHNMIIGAHTHTHVLLNMVDAATSLKEMKTSKKILEEKLQRPCIHFSYPNGARENFTNEHIKQLKQSGYRSAATQISGFNTPGTDVYQLKRINITRDMNLVVFKAYASGNYSFRQPKLSTDY